MISRCGEGRNVQCIDLWPLSSSSKILVRRTYLDFFDDFFSLFLARFLLNNNVFISSFSIFSSKMKTWFVENENEDMIRWERKQKMLIDKISSYLNENSPFHFTFVKWFASQFCHYRSTFVHLNFFAVAYFFQLFHPPHLFFQLSTCVAMSYIHQSNSEFLSFSGGFCFFFLFLALFFHAFKKVWFAVKWNSCHSDTETVSRLIRLVSFWTSIYSFAGLLNFFDSKPSFGSNFQRINKNTKYSYSEEEKKPSKTFCLTRSLSFSFLQILDVIIFSPFMLDI